VREPVQDRRSVGAPTTENRRLQRLNETVEAIRCAGGSLHPASTVGWSLYRLLVREGKKRGRLGPKPSLQGGVRRAV
jgi:hypothetical protein